MHWTNPTEGLFAIPKDAFDEALKVMDYLRSDRGSWDVYREKGTEKIIAMKNESTGATFGHPDFFKELSP